MNSYYKLRKDLTIEVFGRTLFRIEATKDIECHGIKKGGLGGYVETRNNLYGEAWVSGEARVYGEAQVYGEARVYGEAWVSGDKIKTPKDIFNITSNSQYNITITPNYIHIACEFHKQSDWFKFTQKRILEMDGKSGLEWWGTWKPILKAICKIKKEER